MTGIQFVTNEKGKRIAVMIDLETHAALWEDIEDSLISESRRKEKSISYTVYKAKRLKRPTSHA